MNDSPFAPRPSEPRAGRPAEPEGTPDQPATEHPAAEHPTTAYDTESWFAAPAPAPAPAPGTAPPGATPGRSRKAFAAGVVTASLLVGAGAGFGGAAAYDAWLGDDAPSSPTPGTRTTSQVVDTPAQPAADGSVQQVASKVLPSVAKIDVAGSRGAGSGSGIILSSDGQILTNDHVVEAAGDGGTITVSFDDGTSAPARIVGTDPLTDTALIQAQGVEGLTPATIGVSADLAVGQGVVAIGSPFGLDATVTSGIVSALDRPVVVGRDGNGNSTTYPAIQTDAAINPGNSGGPLTDMEGRVIGINSSIRTASTGGGAAGSIGLGFAIPIDEVMPIVEQMSNGETPTHARLGIAVSSVQQDARAGSDQPISGARIEEVSKGSSAEDAGLRAGDVITKVDDRHITSADSLVATVRSYRPGDEVTVTYLRDGEEATAELTLDSDAETQAS